MQAGVKHALVGIALVIRSQMVEYVNLSELHPPSPLLLHPLDLLKTAAMVLSSLADPLSNKRLSDTCRILSLKVRKH